MIDQSKFVELPPEAVTIICELQQQLAESQAREAVLLEWIEDFIDSYHADMEHGVKSLNEKAYINFCKSYPNMSKSIDVAPCIYIEEHDDNTALLAAVRAGKIELIKQVAPLANQVMYDFMLTLLRELEAEQ